MTYRTIMSYIGSMNDEQLDSEAYVYVGELDEVLIVVDMTVNWEDLETEAEGDLNRHHPFFKTL